MNKENQTESETEVEAHPLIMPVCPYCKVEMKAVDYSGYYDSFQFWECECIEIPNAKKESGSYA